MLAELLEPAIKNIYQAACLLLATALLSGASAVCYRSWSKRGKPIEEPNMPLIGCIAFGCFAAICFMIGLIEHTPKALMIFHTSP